MDFTVPGLDEEVIAAMAVGQMAKVAEDASEVLCLVTHDEAGAERTADTLREGIASEPDRFWGGSEVSLLEGEQPGVRVTVPHVHERQGPGWLMFERRLGLIMPGLESRWSWGWGQS
ncbi:hypothetical protein G5C60_29060 [Streptomyces sp. HC44]|uniref:Uncharacterized protein n=1 Tax=Streptomyces scabichelini TaxID=2711217 RepID=A0A6G4VCJ1_9ACTN|nr:hypothetical protein [Streptomyces scabichelini]NGO11537.1 hypothetical protein [Streptomyces scabichelini]